MTLFLWIMTMMLTRGHGHHTCMCGCLSGFYFLKEMKKESNGVHFGCILLSKWVGEENTIRYFRCMMF